MKNAPQIIAILLAAVSIGAHAERSPVPGQFDSRIRTVNYNPNDVVEIIGYYGYTQMIEFAPGETIEISAVGDSLAWQVAPSGSRDRLFLKPVEENARTNLTVVTDRRSYHFDLQSAKARNPQNVIYTVRFRYPEDLKAEIARQEAIKREKREQEVTPNRAVSPENWNLLYSYRGDPKAAPLHVLDDGQFTYFQFREGEALPAIFLVGQDRNESLINFHVKGDYVVVQRVAGQFTLRYPGGTEVCVFNDARDGEQAL